MAVENIEGKIQEALDTIARGLGLDFTDGLDSYNPDPLTPYVVTSFVPLSLEPRYLGPNAPDRFTGMYMVDVMSPIGYTGAQRGGLVSMVVDNFPKTFLVSEDDLEFHVVGRPTPEGAAYRDGVHNRQPIKIVWDFEN